MGVSSERSNPAPSPAPSLTNTSAASRMRLPVILSMGVSWPGHEASGPLVSSGSLRTALGDDYDFLTFARDRPYSKMKLQGTSGASEPDTPRVHRHGDHAYFAPTAFGWASLERRFAREPSALIYFNSFFDPQFTIMPLASRLLRSYATPVLLAPRGELSPGAMSLRSAKKQAMLQIAEWIGLHRQVWLHATSELEAEEIATTLPSLKNRILVAANIRLLDPAPEPPTLAPDGRIRIAFLSRIDPKKNLSIAIAAVCAARAPVAFNIYGPVCDWQYWELCRELIAAAPPNVDIRAFGAVPNSQVSTILAAHDIFFLPTLGENFGHSIFDALAVGTPTLISNATPWRDLEKAEAGWDLSLSAGPAAFATIIDNYAAANHECRRRIWAGARALAERHVREADAARATSEMFRHVISSTPTRSS